jgi:two-component system chemotaxis response regulator CheB
MAFDALDAGAVDYVKKPMIKTPKDMEAFAADIRGKVITASQAKVIQKHSTAIKEDALTQTSISKNKDTIIAIGASTGGTDALQTVLTALPANMPPIVIVQHMPPGFTKMFADRLNKICAVEIREAKDGDRLRSGLALIAPGDFHMSLHKDTQGYFVKIDMGEKVSSHRPSVDYLFNTVAKVAGKNAIGVILTGMGSDGADGMVKMKNQGAYTIGQDKETCVVYGMPMTAYMRGGVTIQAPLDKISSLICKRL